MRRAELKHFRETDLCYCREFPICCPQNAVSVFLMSFAMRHVVFSIQYQILWLLFCDVYWL